MIRTRLHYHRPSTSSEVTALLQEHHSNVAVLGGGSQLLPRMHRDEIHIEHVVDLHDLPLDHIAIGAGQTEIGARVTYADVCTSSELRRFAPLLDKMARGITGGPQLTGQATLVGSACFNYPGSDVPAVLVALNARLRLCGPSGTREVAASDFLLSAGTVDLQPGEFVTSFVVEHAAETGYCKVKHSAGSWPIATASAVRDRRKVVLTLGAVQAEPIQFVVDDRRRLSEQVRSLIRQPWSDVLAPGSYRAAIAAVVAQRALADLP